MDSDNTEDADTEDNEALGGTDDTDSRKLMTAVAFIHHVFAAGAGDILARFGTALTQFRAAGVKVTPDKAAKAAKSAVVESAIAENAGNKSAAARMAGVTWPTVNRITKDLRIGEPPRLCNNPSVATFDDSLFPVILTTWEPNPTETSLNDCKQWLLGTVLLRAVNENKKVVILSDCSSWPGLPSLESFAI